MEDLKGSLRWVPNLVLHPEAHGIITFYGNDAAGKWHGCEVKSMDDELIGLKVCPIRPRRTLQTLSKIKQRQRDHSCQLAFSIVEIGSIRMIAD